MWERVDDFRKKVKNGIFLVAGEFDGGSRLK